MEAFRRSYYQVQCEQIRPPVESNRTPDFSTSQLLETLVNPAVKTQCILQHRGPAGAVSGMHDEFHFAAKFSRAIPKSASLSSGVSVSAFPSSSA